jgi:pilus assembly protein CpaE
MHLITFSIMARNAAARTELKNALFGSAYARLLTESDNPEQLLSDVARVRPSAAVIALEANNQDADSDLIRQLCAASPDTAIITTSIDASASTIMGSIRAGAHEFLQLPIDNSEFQTVIDRISQRRPKNDAGTKTDRRVIAVFSGKGGAGVSFLATNLAAAMNVPAVLVDLNLQNGDAASFLGLEPRYSMADFVANLSRLDDSFMTSLITQHSTNLALLAAPLETHEAEEIQPEHVTEILHLVSQRYPRVVLDLPHTFDPVTVAALDMADDILLVMSLDIPGIRSTKRALSVLERLGYPRARIHVVVNRWTKNIDIELQKVQSHLGEQFLGLVPNDYRKVIDSINLGRPHVHTDPSSRITTEIKRIASSLTSDNTSPLSTQPRRKSLRSLFSRQVSPNRLELATDSTKS